MTDADCCLVSKMRVGEMNVGEICVYLSDVAEKSELMSCMLLTVALESHYLKSRKPLPSEHNFDNSS